LAAYFRLAGWDLFLWTRRLNFKALIGLLTVLLARHGDSNPKPGFETSFSVTWSFFIAEVIPV
jgi:hypothetical protein